MDMVRRDRVRQISERELGMLDILCNPIREFHQRLDSEGFRDDLPGGRRSKGSEFRIVITRDELGEKQRRQSR